MTYYKCIQKIKNNSNIITAYVLLSNTGKTITVNKDVLKQQLVAGCIKVINLKLTSDNKLIDDTSGEIEHILLPAQLEAITKQYGVEIKCYNIEHISNREVYEITVIARVKSENAKFTISTVYKKQINIPKREFQKVIPARDLLASYAYTLVDSNKNQLTLTRDNLIKNHIFAVCNVEIKFTLTYDPEWDNWYGPTVSSFKLTTPVAERTYTAELLTVIKTDRTKLANPNKTLSNKQKLENLINLCNEYKEQHGQKKHKLFKAAKYSYLDSYGDCNWHDCEPEKVLHNLSLLDIQTNISSLYVSDVSYDENDGLIINVCYNNRHIMQLQSRSKQASDISYDMFSRTVRQLSSIEYLLTLLPEDFQLCLDIYVDNYDIDISLTANGNLPALFRIMCDTYEYEQERSRYNLKKILLKYVLTNKYYN